MIVSREINCERILDFGEKRFLKLPVEKFLELEGITPIAPQYALINAVNDPAYRFIVACLSRRTGKTFMANLLAFLKALEPNSKILVVSPNFSLTNISWNEQIKYLKLHDIELESKSKMSREIHLENGSMIKFGSCNNPDSLVGHSYDLIIMDEAALESKGGDVFNIQLRPTLDKLGSKIIFISTPRGLNYFHSFYERGFSPEFPLWFSIHSTWKDNPRAVVEDIEAAKREMSSAEFQQEYEANFTTFEGQIYEAFSNEEHVREIDVRALGECETVMGIDPGYKDHTGAVIFKYSYTLDKYFFVWDYQVNAKTTDKHAEAFATAIDSFRPEMIFCDSAAAQFRQDLAVLYDIPSSKAKKSRLDGITYVQGLVESGKIVVDPRCEDLIMMFNNYRWDPNENLIDPKPKHDKYSHLADALRYALYSCRF